LLKLRTVWLVSSYLNYFDYQSYERARAPLFFFKFNLE